jgi:type VI secretion system protein ImpK
VPAARLKAEGKGEADPVAPNDSLAGRARNRRVEVTLFAKPGS